MHTGFDLIPLYLREFNDSKQLTEAKRDSLFALIKKDERMGFVSEILSAHFISTSMLSRCVRLLNSSTINKPTFNCRCSQALGSGSGTCCTYAMGWVHSRII